MPTRRRIRSRTTSVTGGGPGTVGNVVWGPDFGEDPGSDGVTHQTSVHLAMPSLAMVAADGIGVHVAIPALAMVQGAPKGISCHMAGTALGTVFWQAVGQTDLSAASTATDTTFVLTHPTGLAVGQFMLACVGAMPTSAVALVMTPPAGWTEVDSPGSFVGGPTAGMWWKFATAGDVAAGSSSWNLNAVGGTTRATGEIHRFLAVDATTPIDAAFTENEATVADPVNNGVTTTVVNCLVVAYLCHDHLALSQSHTFQANWTERTDFQDNPTGLFLGSTTQMRTFAAAAATGTVTFNCTETVGSNAISIVAALRPASLVLAT